MFDKAFFNRAEGGAGFGRNGDCAILDQVWQNEYPALFAYLAQDTVDGEKRALASLRLSVDVGQATAVLTDRQYGRIAFYAASSISGALTGLNAALDKGALDWRVDKFAEPAASVQSPRRQRRK